MKVLLSHPFSGALYAFFAEHAENRRRSHGTRTRTTAPYMAITSCLPGPRAHPRPALRGHRDRPGGCASTKGRQLVDEHADYDYRELGLHTEWDGDLSEELDDLAKSDVEDEVAKRVLHRVPESSRLQILRDCRHEIHLAQKHNCPIVCVGGRRLIIEQMIRKARASSTLYNPQAVVMAEQYVQLTGPIFDLPNVEAFADLKSNRELRTYAQAFLHAMSRLNDGPATRHGLLVAMREAISSAAVAKRAAGIFDEPRWSLVSSVLFRFLASYRHSVVWRRRAPRKGSNSADNLRVGSSSRRRSSEPHPWLNSNERGSPAGTGERGH